MQATARTAGTSRLDLVDALRGYALMGLFLVHMEEYFELYWSNPQPAFTTGLVFGLFMGKTFSLLALCFGFSFFVMMDSGRRRGQPFAGRFAWRLILLGVSLTLAQAGLRRSPPPCPASPGSRGCGCSRA